MNNLELVMVDKLKELKEKHGALSVRAEFESEGTKLEELLRLKEICMLSGIKLNLKIGGCESIRDMLEAKTVGVNNLEAPMVESPYSLSKYLQAVTKIFDAEERKSLEFLTDIETKTACDNFDNMLKISEIAILNGIVTERVDLCYSMGLNEDDINSEQISGIVSTVLEKAKSKGLITVVGGGVSADSIEFLRSLGKKLDRYETRKVCFDAKIALKNQPEKGIFKALGFELLWLRNKMSFYGNVRLRDQMRIDTIEHRYWREIESKI